MPTYVFQCADCDDITEAKLGFDDPQPTECPKCGGSLKRQYGNLAVSFRGSGFYRTDSRSSEPNSESSSSSSTSAPASTSSSSKTDGGSSPAS